MSNLATLNQAVKIPERPPPNRTKSKIDDPLASRKGKYRVESSLKLWCIAYTICQRLFATRAVRMLHLHLQRV